MHVLKRYPDFVKATPLCKFMISLLDALYIVDVKKSFELMSKERFTLVKETWLALSLLL